LRRARPARSDRPAHRTERRRFRASRSPLHATWSVGWTSVRRGPERDATRRDGGGTADDEAVCTRHCDQRGAGIAVGADRTTPLVARRRFMGRASPFACKDASRWRSARRSEWARSGSRRSGSSRSRRSVQSSHPGAPTAWSSRASFRPVFMGAQAAQVLLVRPSRLAARPSRRVRRPSSGGRRTWPASSRGGHRPPARH
jgi:hypothetical protein